MKRSLPLSAAETSCVNEAEETTKRLKTDEGLASETCSGSLDIPLPGNFWTTANNKSLVCHFNQLIESSFDRKFSFAKETGPAPAVRLPEVSYPAGVTGSSSCLSDHQRNTETKLNETKSAVGRMEPAEWRSLTNYTDLSSGLRYSVKYDEGIELGTNAWLKFWSILHEFPELTETPCHFGSVHLCEAPGAFVASLNHYLAQNHPARHGQWRWLASSLSPFTQHPTNEAITDDRMIRCTENNWYFGTDGTGNLKSRENRDSIVAQTLLKLEEKVHLVTADGGIDCSEHPAEQESDLAALKFAETTTALRLLQLGGHYVLKIFTVFRRETSVLLKVLTFAFEEVIMYKPATSKAGNSEVYMICLRYKGMEQDHITVIDRLASDPLLLDNAAHTWITAPFQDELVQASENFAQLQSKAIKLNLSIFGINCNRRVRTAFHKAKHRFCDTFMSKYPIEPAPKNARLLNAESSDNNDHL